VSPEALDRVKAPAGLDLGAITPEEIAMSILAEITVERRRGQRASNFSQGS
jgi:xanthine dehydrogenase accessory factor